MKIIRLEARPDVIGRLGNANKTDRESRNAVVGHLAHLDRADPVSKSKRFWTRTSSSGPRHRGGCVDPAGAIAALGDPLHFVPRTSRYTTSTEQFEVPLAAPRGPVLFRQVARLKIYFGNLNSYFGYHYFGYMNDHWALDVRCGYPKLGQMNVYLGYLQF